MKNHTNKKYYTATDKRYQRMQWQILGTLLLCFFIFSLLLFTKMI